MSRKNVNLERSIKMLAMDIQTDKLDLIQWLASLTDTKMIGKLKAMRASDKTRGGSLDLDFWDELDEDVKLSIERGIKDAEAGRVESHEDVMKEFAQWR